MAWVQIPITLWEMIGALPPTLHALTCDLRTDITMASFPLGTI